MLKKRHKEDEQDENDETVKIRKKVEEKRVSDIVIENNLSVNKSYIASMTI